MFVARLLSLSACGALAARPEVHEALLQKQASLDPKTLERWGDASWKEPCWGTPDPEQQLNGEVLQSICARLHQNASFLVFGLGRDSKLWYKNAVSKNIVFLENHEDWLQFQDEDVAAATRIVQYTSDATAYKQDLHDETKLAALFESLPADIKDTPWDMILVDSPMGMETPVSTPKALKLLGVKQKMQPIKGTPGRTQSIYAARRLAQERTIVFVDDVHRMVEHESVNALLQHPYQTLKVFSSGHKDENGIPGKTSMLMNGL